MDNGSTAKLSHLNLAPNLFGHRRYPALRQCTSPGQKAHASQHHDPRKKVLLPGSDLEIQPLSNWLDRVPGTEYAAALHHTPLEPLLPTDGLGIQLLHTKVPHFIFS